MSEIDDTVAELQAEIRRRRAELDALRSDDPSYDAALRQLVKSTEDLLTYEKQIPEILDEPRRRRSEQILRRVVVLFPLEILLLLVLVLQQRTNDWWLWLLIPLLIVGTAQAIALLFGQPKVGREHIRQRRGAYLLVTAGIITLLLVAGVFSGGGMITVCVLGVLGFVGASLWLIDFTGIAEGG